MVYNDEACSVLEYMAWMWREFLVFSAMRGSPVSAGEVIKDDDLYEQVFSLFRQDTSGMFSASQALQALRLTDDGTDPQKRGRIRFLGWSLDARYEERRQQALC